MSENLRADDILIAEFEHIAQVATQNNEDRARVSTFYLVTVGSFLAAILGLQIENLNPLIINAAFAAIFFIIFLNGMVTVLQLVKLRRAWFESVLAMNHIKEFYTQNAGIQKLEDAFLWDNTSLPSGFKPWSVSFLLTLQVALFTGAALGGAIAFLALAMGGLNTLWWILSIGSALLISLLQIGIYWLGLRQVSP